MAAGSIVVDLLMKTGSFETDTKRAERSLKSLEKQAIDAGKKIATAMAGIATATALLVRSQINAADAMGKAAQQAGVTSESLSALAFAAEMSGSSQQEMTQALARLSRQMSEAASGSGAAQAAFEQLGVKVTDASGRLRRSDDVFRDLAERFAAMPDGVEKTAAAIDIFGRSGANLIPLLNSGAQGLDAMRQEAERLGIVIDTQTAIAAAEFNDNVTRLQKNLSGLGLAAAREVLPALISITEAMLGFNSAAKMGEVAGAAFRVVLQTIAVLGSEAVFMIEAIARRLGAMAAQLAALRRLDFRGAIDIGRMVNADDRAMRQRVDEFQRRVMGLEQRAAAASSAGATFTPAMGASGGTARGGSSRDGTAAALREAQRAEQEYSQWLQTMRDGEIRRFLDMEEERERAVREHQQNLAREAQRYYDATRTPAERLNIELENQRRLLRELGPAYEDTYFRAVAAAKAAYAETEKVTNQMDDFAKRAAENIQSSLGSGLADLMNGNFSNIAQGFTQMLNRMVAEAMAANLSRYLFGDLVGGTGGGVLGGALRSFGSALFGGSRAGGGDVIGGRAFLVGENGPEMFVPRTNGTILPNMAGAGGGGNSMSITNNFTVSGAVDKRTQLQIAREASMALQRGQRNM